MATQHAPTAAPASRASCQMTGSPSSTGGATISEHGSQTDCAENQANDGRDQRDCTESRARLLGSPFECLCRQVHPLPTPSEPA